MKRVGLLIQTILVVLLLTFLVANVGLAADAASVKLKFASISSPNHVLNVELHQPWIEKVEKDSGGKIKITLFSGGALGKAKQAYDIATDAIADISYGWTIYYPGRFPLTEAYTLPGVVPNIEAAYNSWNIYQKYLKNEWSGVKLLWLGVAPGYIFITKDKPIKVIDDVKGMKLGCIGKIAADVVSALGGTPVDITAQDAYTSLQRGVIDGYVNTWASTASNKHGEVAKYFTNANLFNSIFFCVMNLDKYNSLPPDLKKVIDDNSGESMFKSATDTYWNDQQQAKKAVMEQTGGKGEFFDLSPAESAKYRNMVKPIWQEWIAAMEKKGLPGQEVMDALSSFASK